MTQPAGQEWFDVVDPADQVVSKATRTEVHARGWLHRAVHIWLLNAEGHILIQLRSAAKDCHPRTWDSSASGHLDSGESYAAAADREIVEELGLPSPPPLQEIAYCTDTSQLDQEFVRVYLGHTNGPFLPLPEEIDEVRWTTPAELSAWMQREPHAFAPAFRHLWQRYHTLLAEAA